MISRCKAIKKTRYKELGYRCDAPGLWRIYHLDDGRESAVGEQYKSKDELLSDLTRYATEFGCYETK